MIEESDPRSANLSPKLLHAFDLIFALCEERLAPEQLSELESLVCRDLEIRTFYVDMMQLRSSLHCYPGLCLTDRFEPSRRGICGPARSDDDQYW